MRKKIALCLALAMSLSMTACKATPTNAPSVETSESTSATETAETTVTFPEVTTVPVETTVPEETTTPEITTTEATTTTVITTTVPETTTTTVPETTTVVTTTTAPATTTTVATTPIHSIGYDTQFTQEWIDATNAERRRLGVPELKMDKTLTECAAIRAKEMCENSYVEHVRPNGDKWTTVMPESFFWMTRGEIAARTRNPSDGTKIYQTYANSPAHYQGMTSAEFSRAGAYTYCDSQGRVYSCMILVD